MASTYRESCTPRVAQKAWQCVFSDLPLEVAGYYIEMQRADAASTLQAALQRHRVVRCDDPRHRGRVTYSRAPVACYALTHAHPGRVACSSSRTAYFERCAFG